MTLRLSCSLAVSLLLGSAAVPAADFAPRLAHGSRKLVMRKAPLASTAAAHGNPSSPTCYDSNQQPMTCSGLQVQYYGGHVIPNVKVYAIFWTSAVDAATQSGVGPFFGALTDSAVMDWLAEYDTNIAIQAGGSAGQQGTGQLIGRGAFAGAYVIAPTINTGRHLVDADVTAELDAQIVAGNLPENDASSVFMIYFPPGTVIDDGYGNLSCQQFCAYHGTFTRGPQSSDAYYAIIPDFSGPDALGGDCSLGCGAGWVFDNITSASSHELLEAVTDAEVGLVSSFDPPLGWYDGETSSQGEIGDMCNQQTDTISGPGGASFTVQQVYSQKTALCQTSYRQAHDFALSLSPAAATVLPGGATAAVPVAATNTAGAAQNLALSLDTSSLPAGVTATLGQASISSDGGSTTLTFAATAAAAHAQDLMVVVTATGSSGVVHTAATLLQVGPPTIGPGSRPTVALTGAAPGATLSGTVMLAATGVAATAGTLASVSLGIDGTQVATGTSSASYAWDTTRAASLHATITATATDTDGASATTTVAVSVGNALVARVTSPASGAVVAGIVAVAASGTARGGTLASLALAVDGVQAATGTAAALSFSWDTTQVANGAHLLVAQATDGRGGAGTSAPVAVLVKNPPRVVLDAGAPSATVSGTVPLQVTATAPAGTALAELALQLDGQTVAVAAESPHAFSWDTSLLANGAHVLAAVATTQDGATATSAALTVAVVNDFTLAVGPGAGTAIIGGTAALFSVSTAAVAGRPLIALSATGVPAGVTASFSPATVHAGESAQLIVDAPAGTAAIAAVSLVVTGTSAGVPAGHSATATLAVDAQPVAHGGCSSAGGPGWELLALLGVAPALLLRRRRAQA